MQYLGKYIEHLLVQNKYACFAWHCFASKWKLLWDYGLPF